MKARWIAPLIVLAAAAAFVLGQRCAATAGGSPLDPLKDTARLERVLKLTPEQATKFRALCTNFHDRVQTACDSHCEARCGLAKKLFRDGATAAEAGALLDRMTAAYADQERATLDHLIAVRELLTPEQVRALEKEMAFCICSHCAASEGGCCGGDK